MDYKKIATDFEKRYGKKCASMFFCGKPLTFFSGVGITVGCSVSVGGCIAVSPREDDRITIQFSDSNEIFRCNRADFAYNKDRRITDILESVEKYGVKTGGADMFMYCNSKISNPVEQMLLGALGSFCDNVSTPREIIKHFEKYEENIICFSSRKGHLTVLDGQRVSYVPFSDEEFKIILCYIGGKALIKRNFKRGTAEEAIKALLLRDTERFGALLNKETEANLKADRAHGAYNLFKTSTELKDAIGNGVLTDGGIFSIVKNGKADTFMHNLGNEYEKHYGKRPDFYVTRAEDSGISVTSPE